MSRRLRCTDPRIFQIATLAALLLYGIAGLDLEVRLLNTLVILVTALATQAVACHWVRIRFDPLSPLISALSLCLLLRSSSLSLVAAAAALAIGSKFVLRVSGKHLFNPTNLALVTLLLLSDRVWVSPGQWGNAALFGFLLAGVGGLVTRRSARSDVTVAFLAAYGGGLLARAVWLGDPLAIPFHQLQSGALLIFAFLMISDPKTTPDSRPGRLLFALLVAVVALGIRFVLFRPNDLLWALALAAPTVPLLDRLLPGTRYQWSVGRAPLGGLPPPPFSHSPALAFERSS